MTALFNDRRLQLLLLLAPGVGYLLFFFGTPLFQALRESLVTDQGDFTLMWYQRAFSRPSMVRGLTTSLYYGLAPVFVSLALSVPLSVLIRQSFIGRKLFNGLYKLPLAVPSLIAALAVIILAEQGGFLDRVLAHVGLSLPKIVRDDAGLGVIFTSAWKQVPFMTLIITSAFAAIPEDLRLAARAFGASRLQTFLRVEVPLAMPGISAAVLLTFIGSMGSYAIPDLVGPPSARPLSVLMVEGFKNGKFHEVYAMGMILSAFAIAVLIAYYTLTHRIGPQAVTGDER
ncbi:ABC transporter permease [Xaviernesmea oryzae]|uniref:ABC transporter permease n=1 Tax=Xaviernesmea oryzae TaxID=464029 RepID=A0A1Q9ATX0_9HYPH|nr:ABC transporter permease [Xaviernesmea oryzae]OLP58876.1 ABC transporter permease [Xaviernesmea oryzae]SEM03156.1 putative spermidine/putrescine transport system permease protein [Xaviernesmea oryzae]